MRNEGGGNGFAGAEGRWQDRLGRLRDVVRQELVAGQLAEVLPAPPLHVLDAGCGQGTQALRLARRGHRVTGLDGSAELLARFAGALAGEPPGVRDRVGLVRGPLERLADLVAPAAFDAVLCHGVLMYFDDPSPVLGSIATVVRPGGVVSLLVRNGDALAMRPGLFGDWRSALVAFDATSYVNRIGVTARADRLADLSETLTDLGMPVRTWYGVRVFTDTAADEASPPPPDELATLLACEERAARTDPYRRIAALLHLVATRTAP